MSDGRTRAELRLANGRLVVENGELREKLAAAMRVVAALRAWRCAADAAIIDTLLTRTATDAARAAALEEAAKECERYRKALSPYGDGDEAHMAAGEIADRIRALAKVTP